MAHTPASVSVSARLRLRDVFHPAVAGLVSVIVNYGGTFILVFQAARVAGLDAAHTALCGAGAVGGL